MAKLPVDVKALARVHTETALRVLADVMNDESAPPSVRVECATELLSRARFAFRGLDRFVLDHRKYYVYSIKRAGRLVYVGKGIGGRARVSARALKSISRIRAIFNSEVEALRFERRLIGRFRPIENIQLIKGFQNG